MRRTSTAKRNRWRDKIGHALQSLREASLLAVVELEAKSTAGASRGLAFGSDVIAFLETQDEDIKACG